MLAALQSDAVCRRIAWQARVANGLRGALERNGASTVLDTQVPRAKDSAFPHDQQIYEPDAEPSDVLAMPEDEQKLQTNGGGDAW